jgi:hypothetical protein
MAATLRIRPEVDGSSAGCGVSKGSQGYSVLADSRDCADVAPESPPRRHWTA